LIRKIKILFAICFLVSNLNAQEEIYTITEQMAEFPGGVTEMMKFVQTTLQYPQMCRENNIGGKVFLKFVVNTEGDIKSVEVIKSSGNIQIDNEAIRVVNQMPKWKPAMMTGKAVSCYFNLPLNFKMSDTPYFIFNVSNKSGNYMSAVNHINNGEIEKARGLLLEDTADEIYLLAVIDYMNKDKKKACKKFTKFIEMTDDKSGQKSKIASGYLEKNCA